MSRIEQNVIAGMMVFGFIVLGSYLYYEYWPRDDHSSVQRCLMRHGAAKLDHHDHYIGCDIWPKVE